LYTRTRFAKIFKLSPINPGLEKITGFNPTLMVFFDLLDFLLLIVFFSSILMFKCFTVLAHAGVFKNTQRLELARTL